MHEAYYATLLEELASRDIDTATQMPQAPQDITPAFLGESLARALHLTDDPGLSIAYGLRLRLASHGILGYALMSSRNGDQLLALLSRYAALVMPGLTLKRVVSGERLLLVCDAQAGLLPREFLLELALTTLIAGARMLFDRRIPGAEVWLDYPQPAHAERYALLKIPMRFAQPYAALVCQRSFLEMDVASANPAMAQIGARQCDVLLAQMRSRTGTAQRIRRSLLRGRGTFPSQAEMAAGLHLSPRTLRRRLREEGTHYREIVDEVRFELAKGYLRTAELTVGQIAELLAYDDPANFRRAFKRWSGSSAQIWRQENAG